jgi:heparan-alpha-glucosaminide N-acetyltransferase
MIKLSGERFDSIDAFRGLTILAMVFVNDLASVKNIPNWLKHYPAEADGMTFVDLVFPAFLFIVGMAIPLAIQNRVDKGESFLQIWKHILIRSAGLIVLGVFMVNIIGLNPIATGISKSWWMLLLFIAAILIWNRYPKKNGWKKNLYRILHLFGFIIIIVLALIYRGGESENLRWLQTSWWGILGLIGWAYLTCCAVYLIFSKNLAAMTGMLALFIMLYIGDKTGSLDFLMPIKKYLWLGGHIGGHAAITISGTITTLLLFDQAKNETIKKRIFSVLFFTAMLLIAGYLIRPLYGISKVYATPTWCLYSSAICCAIFLLLFWLIDIKGISKWNVFLQPAGSNPLLAYIMPDIVYALIGILGITFLSDYFGDGIVGILRSFILAMLMLGLTALATKFNIKLRL